MNSLFLTTSTLPSKIKKKKPEEILIHKFEHKIENTSKSNVKPLITSPTLSKKKSLKTVTKINLKPSNKNKKLVKNVSLLEFKSTNKDLSGYSNEYESQNKILLSLNDKFEIELKKKREYIDSLQKTAVQEVVTCLRSKEEDLVNHYNQIISESKGSISTKLAEFNITKAIYNRILHENTNLKAKIHKELKTSKLITEQLKQFKLLFFDSKLSYSSVKVENDSLNKFHGNRYNEFNSVLERKSEDLSMIHNHVKKIQSDKLDYEKHLQETKILETQKRDKLNKINYKLKSILSENKTLLNEFLHKRIQHVRLLNNKQLKNENKNLDNIIILYMEKRIQYEGYLSLVCITNKEINEYQSQLSEQNQYLNELKAKINKQAINHNETLFEYEDKQVNAILNKISNIKIYSNLIENKASSISDYLTKFFMFMIKYSVPIMKQMVSSSIQIKMLNVRRESIGRRDIINPIDMIRNKFLPIFKEINSLEISNSSLYFLLNFIQDFMYKIQLLFYKKIMNSYVNNKNFINKNNIYVIDDEFLNNEYSILLKTPKSSKKQKRLSKITDDSFINRKTINSLAKNNLDYIRNSPKINSYNLIKYRFKKQTLIEDHNYLREKILNNKNCSINNIEDEESINESSISEKEEKRFHKVLKIQGQSLKDTDYLFYLRRNDKLSTLRLLRKKNEVQSLNTHSKILNTTNFKEIYKKNLTINFKNFDENQDQREKNGKIEKKNKAFIRKDLDKKSKFKKISVDDFNKKKEPKIINKKKFLADLFNNDFLKETEIQLNQLIKNSRADVAQLNGDISTATNTGKDVYKLPQNTLNVGKINFSKNFISTNSSPLTTVNTGRTTIRTRYNFT